MNAISKLSLSTTSLLRSRAFGAFGLVGCAALTLIEQWRLVSSLLGRYTNEDHAILWLAASDWMRLRPREPTFYGQPYGVNFEAIPMGLLHALGMSYGTAFPVALLGMALAAWWLLAFGAYRRGATVAALCAVAAPLLLNLNHWVIVGVIGTGAGRLLAAAAASAILRATRGVRAMAWSVAMGGLAVAMDAASAMLVVPAFAWACLSWIRVRRFWIPLILGALPSLAWKGYNAWFEATHPDHALHAAWVANTSWESFLNNFNNPDRLFAVHALELYPHGELIAVVSVLFLVISVVALSARAILSAASLLTLLIALSALDKSMDDSASLWFSASRMTLIAPMSLWFVGFVSIDALCSRYLSAASRSLAKRLSCAALAAGVLCTQTVRARGWNVRIDAIESVGLLKENMPLRKIEDVEERCAEANVAARDAGTRIILFPHDRTLAYACAALHRSLLTAHPAYERRAWVLHALSEKPADRMVLWNVDTRECKRKPYRRELESCVSVAAGHAILATFSPQAPLNVVRRLGFSVRPFGEGCHPVSREGCSWWSAHYER